MDVDDNEVPYLFEKDTATANRTKDCRLILPFRQLQKSSATSSNMYDGENGFLKRVGTRPVFFVIFSLR